MDNKELTNIKQHYDIVGNYDGLNRAIELALKIAPVDLSVMILGENGVGKEIFPKIIHDYSARKKSKYLAVNCGAIPEGTIDSELFGHEKGAFTGALEKREGYFATVNGGTLFLDEVGELPLSTQARLLRVLETGEYIPVGSSEIRKTDVRIVAATNVEMQEAIRKGKFREDLYYRLNNVPIRIPPLRERGKDIVSLFKKFALEMSEAYHMPRIQLDQAAEDLLLQYQWPGNVRQLKNLAENISITSDSREISADILKRYLPAAKQTQLVPVGNNEHSYSSEREILYKILFDLRQDVTELKQTVRQLTKKDIHNETEVPTNVRMINHSPINSEDTSCNDYEELNNAPLSLEDQEKKLIEKALEQTEGHRKTAAERLGISERTLYRKIKEYGLEN